MKAVVIYSGGMDSTTLLYDLKKRGYELEALSFDYGSKHNDKEFLMARDHCHHLKIPRTVINLSFINKHFKSDLLKNGGEIPEGHYSESTMKKTVVPFRNGIMLSIAVGYAESIGAEAVFVGSHFGDHAVYPDCRESFVNGFREAAKEGTYNQVKIIAPYTDILKEDIAKIGADLGINFANTWSCYKGGAIQCGRCSTCFERREALFNAQVSDHTVYLDKTPIKALIEIYNERLKKDV